MTRIGTGPSNTDGWRFTQQGLKFDKDLAESDKRIREQEQVQEYVKQKKLSDAVEQTKFGR